MRTRKWMLSGSEFKRSAYRQNDEVSCPSMHSYRPLSRFHFKRTARRGSSIRLINRQVIQWSSPKTQKS